MDGRIFYHKAQLVFLDWTRIAPDADNCACSGDILGIGIDSLATSTCRDCSPSNLRSAVRSWWTTSRRTHPPCWMCRIHCYRGRSHSHPVPVRSGDARSPLPGDTFPRRLRKDRHILYIGHTLGGSDCYHPPAAPCRI